MVGRFGDGVAKARAGLNLDLAHHLPFTDLYLLFHSSLFTR